METYDPMRPCPKCGGLATKDNWRAGGPAFDWRMQGVPDTIPERIVRTCSNCGYVREETPLATETSAAGSAVLVHLCPVPGASVTPCCGQLPFELPITDQVTEDAGLVTCQGPA